MLSVGDQATDEEDAPPCDKTDPPAGQGVNAESELDSEAELMRSMGLPLQFGGGSAEKNFEASIFFCSFSSFQIWVLWPHPVWPNCSARTPGSVLKDHSTVKLGTIWDAGELSPGQQQASYTITWVSKWTFVPYETNMFKYFRGKSYCLSTREKIKEKWIISLVIVQMWTDTCI